MGFSENTFYLIDCFMTFYKTACFFNIIVFHTIQSIFDKVTSLAVNFL
ncbi:Uncharacterised protein [Mycobacterium tuberculosis]|uniref:Uncharacterized protein n=1 Tax=Mycobacterium tuberculosis TaxID=1773 RepID=A0A655AN61_MYCTX|nr:Uncharacterised protein [Mycobacterium tuberculosis]CKU96897.1 Uncharacterised protein [Mycobacterium tuberculosis]CKV45578.1 Uncharacterised protein [Mycobacterium tuberculosis]